MASKYETPEQKAKELAYQKGWREKNAWRKAAANRRYREKNAAALRQAARVKYRVSVGLEGDGTVRVKGVGVPIAKKRLSLWVRSGFSEMMASWTYLQARFDYAAWCDEIDRESERRLRWQAIAERGRAAARDSERWAFERFIDLRGHTVFRCRKLPPHDKLSLI